MAPLENAMIINTAIKRFPMACLSQRGAMMLATALALAVAPAAQAEDRLPSGAKILDDYVRNTGGKAAYKRLKNSLMKATFSMPAMGMTMSLTKYAAEPNNSYTRLESDMMGVVEEGTNGDVVWSKHPMMGNNIKSGSDRDQSLRQAFFHEMLKWREIYKEAKCVEIAEFEGESCYKVVITPKIGEDFTEYFETDTGLQRGTELTIENPMAGKMSMTVILEDYKEVSGILYPHTITQRLPQMEMILTVESIEHNVDIPKDRFALPADILELLKQQQDADSNVPEPSKEKSGD